MPTLDELVQWQDLLAVEEDDDAEEEFEDVGLPDVPVVLPASPALPDALVDANNRHQPFNTVRATAHGDFVGFINTRTPHMGLSHTC